MPDFPRSVVESANLIAMLHLHVLLNVTVSIDSVGLERWCLILLQAMAWNDRWSSGTEPNFLLTVSQRTESTELDDSTLSLSFSFYRCEQVKKTNKLSQNVVCLFSFRIMSPLCLRTTPRVLRSRNRELSWICGIRQVRLETLQQPLIKQY